MPKTKGQKYLAYQLIELVMRKHREGEKTAKIASDLRQKYHTVYRIIERGGIKRKIPGRPRKISPKLERCILRTIEREPNTYATEITSDYATSVSPKTVVRCLRRAGVRSRVARRRPGLSEKQIRDRLEFALKHKDEPISFL